MNRVGKVFKKISKVVLWIAISLALLFIIIILLVQVPSIQNKIIHQVTTFVSNKTSTKVEIDRISISLAGAVIVNGLFLEDIQEDTLLYVGTAKMRISLISLINSKINIDYFNLEEAYLNVNRPLTDSLYNFNFLLTAFSDTTTEQSDYPKKESKWTFDVNNVGLTSIRIHFDDEFGGIEVQTSLHKFDLIVNKIDFEESIYGINNLQIDSLVASVLRQESTKPEKKKTDVVLPIITANNIQISNSSISYGDSVIKQSLAAQVNQFELNKGSVDLQKENVTVDKVSLSKSKISFNTSSNEELTDSTILENNALPKENNWEVAAKHIELIDNTVAYNVVGNPIIPHGFDPNHMEYEHLNLNASNFYYTSLITNVSVHKFSTVDRNGFSINSFETDFSMDQHSITANQLKVNTTNSSIDADMSIRFSSLESLRDSLQHMILNLDFKSVSIANSDIVYFSNQLSSQPFFKNKATVTNITGKVNGPINSLTGEDLVIKTGANTILKTDFVIKGLPNVQIADFSVPSLSIVSGKKDIEMMAGSFIPKSIELPEEISTQISFSGMLKSFELDVELNTSYGSANLVVSIDNEENFQSKIDINSFNLGSLLRDTAMFGPFTLTAEVNGKGFDFNTVEARIRAEATEIYLNGYNYHKLILEGDISGKQFAGLVSLDDENAALDFDGLVSLNPDQERYKFRLNLKGANLHKLNFTKDDIRVGLKASADLEGGGIKTLNGTAGISNLIVVKDQEVYELDSLLFASINESGKSEINISSALVGVKYSGTLSPIDLVTELSAFANNYFPFSDSVQLATNSEPSHFNLEIQFSNHPIISQVLLPELDEFESGVITGSFNSEQKKLKLHAAMNRIVYGSTDIKKLALDISSDPTELKYKVSSSSVSNAQIKLDNLLVEGKLSNNIMLASLSSVDQDLKKKIEIHSQITKEEGNYRLTLKQNDFYLMHNRWNIAEDNYIEFGEDGILIHNFFLQSESSQINVASVNNRFNDDINIEVVNLRLDDLSRIIEKDTSLVKGQLDGNVLLKRINNFYGLIADAQISNLIIREVPIGNLTVKADNPTAERFDVDVNLSGQENSITANGYFIAKDGNNTINIKTDIQSLSMETIEAFSMGQITETSGAISGELTATGDAIAPEITGELVFKDAFINPAFLNNRLELQHETIQFRTDGIYFQSFTILDPHQQTAIIDGSVKMEKFRDFVFALTVNTDNFQLFNTTAKDSKEFFGRMIIDSQIDVNGPMSLPVINARVTLKNGSNFTFAVPERRLTTDRGEDVVDFASSLKTSPILHKAEDTTPQRNIFTGFDLSTIIEIDKEATLRLLLDPSSSDSLVVRGEAALSFSIDQSGKMSLTGAYHVSEGSYLVSLESIVKRRFEIMSGSTITWSGDPLDAEISIDARYTVRAAPYDLLVSQMASLSDMESSAYKQRYPFWVMLKLRGEILHPEIRFEIQLPPEEKGILGGTVNQKLSLLNEDESALNKQVFALLVMGRFIQENPLQTESGGTSSLVRATVGNLLSEQLNQLSSRVISGVELGVDIQSFDDYQTGEAEGRTQVEIGVQKDFFNDRLSVQVGGMMDVEGERAKQNTASDIAGDVMVEYKLTEDGRFRLKGFRQNQYEGALEGQLVETGVGVAFVRDFNRWRNFFRRQKTQKDSTSVTNENHD